MRIVAIPRKGKPDAARRAHEHSRAFRRLVKWRTGCEGRIACLKRQYGWDRTRPNGLAGCQIWCGLGVFAHNLVKIANLIAAKTARASRRPIRPPPSAATPAA